ncbi:MAG: hypothetical protein JNM56_29990 [Planctomycetia bacterium]|nr:hypothetical protein [Planctomycetia bacterium]
MPRWLLDWQRSAAWCAVCALVVASFANEVSRLPASWLLPVPSNNERSPVEETEPPSKEVVAAAPLRQRTRQRLAPLSLPLHPAHSMLIPPLIYLADSAALHSTPLDLAAIIGSGLPLRC